MADFSDREWMQKLYNGEREGYEALFAHYYVRVFHFVCSVVKDECLAEDIAQDVFMKLWLMRDHILGETVEHLLFVIARNEVKDYFRQQAVIRRYRSQVESLPEPRQTFEEEYYANELNDFVNLALQKLSDRQREIFVLSRNEGLSNKEIAERLGISVRTVEKHIEIALKQIHRFIPFLLLFLTFGR